MIKDRRSKNREYKTDWGIPIPYGGSKSIINRIKDPNNDLPINDGQIKALLSFREKLPVQVDELLHLVVTHRLSASGFSLNFSGGSFEYCISQLFKWEANWMLGSLMKYKGQGQTKQAKKNITKVTPSEIKRYINYYDYIESVEWAKKSKAAKIRAGFRCQVCNRSDKETILHTHHRTYERLGHERDEDLTVLCVDCHKLFETTSQFRPSKRK